MGIESLTVAARAAGFAMAASEDPLLPAIKPDKTVKSITKFTAKEAQPHTEGREPATAGRWLREVSGLLARRRSPA